MIYLKTIAQYMVVFFCVLVINFVLPRVAPGTPATYLISGIDLDLMSDEEVAAVLSEFKLNLPIMEQFFNYITGVFKRDLGVSVIYGRPVWDILVWRLPWTLLIMGVSLLLSASLGIFIGVIGAWKRGGTRDVGSLFAVMFIGSVPPFWIAMLLITLFSATLNWLPSYGAYPLAATAGSQAYFMGVLKRLVMPVLTLTIAKTGSMYLITRSSMVIAMEDDYVLLAHAKGLKEKVVVFKHVLSNAILPIYTNLMMGLGAMVGGASVIETVFSYPGIGNTIYESVSARDYSLLQGSFLVVSVSVLLCNLIAELGYPLLDPRTRRKGVHG